MDASPDIVFGWQTSTRKDTQPQTRCRSDVRKEGGQVGRAQPAGQLPTIVATPAGAHEGSWEGQEWQPLQAQGCLQLGPAAQGTPLAVASRRESEGLPCISITAMGQTG